jgi:hypothetical protein
MIDPSGSTLGLQFHALIRELINGNFLVTNAQTLKLRDKKSNLNQDQWEKVLSVFLLGVAGQKEPLFLDGVELVADVEEAISTNIVIRKRVEGITVRHIHSHYGSRSWLTFILANPRLNHSTCGRKRRTECRLIRMVRLGGSSQR